MTLKPPADINAPFTQAELRELAVHLPSAVRVDEEGNIFPLVDRREVFQLQLRYPSLDPRQRPTQPTSSGDAGEDILRARYPSMYRGTP